MYKKRKRCFMCDRLILYNRAACSDHAALYNKYKDELWCKELVSAEINQGRIAQRECVDISNLSYLTETSQTPVKPKGNSVITLYHSGKTAKEIASELNMKYDTVRKIIYRSKKNDTRNLSNLL